MNSRKQHTIQVAHRLFIEKGYQATSIQDILENSSISKGTFYNYFSSKSELMIAIFNSMHEKLEKERNKLMIGQSPADTEIFIKQIEVQLISNKKNNIFTLIEEVLVSNELELRQSIQQIRLLGMNWLYNRFIDIFGADKKPYLLDCTILFEGMLHHLMHVNFVINQGHSEYQVSNLIRYSFKRISKIVEDVSAQDEQIFYPELLKQWLPDKNEEPLSLVEEILNSIHSLKRIAQKYIQSENDISKFFELLSFLEQELIQDQAPREFIIESVLTTLHSYSHPKLLHSIMKFSSLIEAHLEK
ncbi:MULTISPECIES: TetR/AcrR family transcriptional regulator [Bacillaceae]|uniref:AcrR family transcriptional regulator n=1 Tax=Peribacillus huizhouensis TaxID=1501239 RepID=A0ABR6CPJ7_9BACI|nr:MULTISPECIES: TetR/AcrR family transcriptional regulator [Bacillaceae]MBA9026962.1 AcrR family transcriptional regulator [Peribacillus huizhouensis]